MALVNKLDGHYFASSVAEWRVSDDLEGLIKYFKSEDFPFVIWHIPLDIHADYKINGYVPDVYERTVIANYTKKEEK
jgi:hypothetical protein